MISIWESVVCAAVFSLYHRKVYMVVLLVWKNRRSVGFTGASAPLCSPLYQPKELEMVSCDKVQKKQISRKTKTDFGCGELERQTVSVTQTPFPSTRTVLHLLSLRIKVLPSSEIYDTPAKRRTLCAAFSLLSKWERQY